MEDFILSIVLGIVEGLTEFLPVSSTAHIRLALGLYDQSLLASGYWKMYTVVIQLGAILSVVVYFRQRIIDFLRSFIAARGSVRSMLLHPLSLVMVAFVVTAVPSLLVKDMIKDNLESLMIMGVALIAGGVVMWIVDVTMKRPTTLRMDDMKPWQAAVIGAFQILAAIFPGTSRSMATIVGGQLAGLSRSAALEFSFFLSMPIMLAAGVFDLLESLKAQSGEPAYIEVPMNAHYWGVLAVGFAVSFVVALAVIHWFMNYVRTRGFVPFAIYRIIVGVAVVWWASRSAL